MELTSSNISEADTLGVFRWDTELSSIKFSKSTFSPAFNLGGLEWKISLTKDEFDNNFTFSMFMWLIEKDWTFGSVNASMKFMLLSNTNCINNYHKETSKLFTKFDGWGYKRFLQWDDFCNAEKGYHKNGKLTVELQLRLSEIVGLRRVDRVNFVDPSEPLHNVTLLINGEKVYACKQILAHNSPVFYKMFFGEFKERKGDEVALDGVDKEELMDLLRMIYPPKSAMKKITSENVDATLRLADFYHVQDLINEAEEFLLTKCDWSRRALMEAAERYRLSKLKKHCIEELGCVSEPDKEKTLQ